MILQANVVVETANEEHATNFKDKLRDLYPMIRFAIVDIDDKNKLGLRWYENTMNLVKI